VHSADRRIPVSYDFQYQYRHIPRNSINRQVLVWEKQRVCEAGLRNWLFKYYLGFPVLFRHTSIYKSTSLHRIHESFIDLFSNHQVSSTWRPTCLAIQTQDHHASWSLWRRHSKLVITWHNNCILRNRRNACDQDAINTLRHGMPLRARDIKSWTHFSINCWRPQKHTQKNSILHLG
jgi:hypothetical protein